MDVFGEGGPYLGGGLGHFFCGWGGVNIVNVFFLVVYGEGKKFGHCERAKSFRFTPGGYHYLPRVHWLPGWYSVVV